MKQKMTLSALLIMAAGLCTDVYGGYSTDAGTDAITGATAVTTQQQTGNKKTKPVRTISRKKGDVGFSAHFCALPAEYEGLTRYVSRELFGTENTTLTKAFDSYVEASEPLPENGGLFVVDIIRQTNNTISVMYYHKVGQKADERYAIYDTKKGRVLTMEDVFTPEALGNKLLAKAGKDAAVALFANSIILNGDKPTMISIEKHATWLTEEFRETIGVVKNDKKAGDEDTEKDSTKEALEEMPQFPGGQNAMMSWLSKNMKYPAIAQNDREHGRVIVNFIVGKDGTVDNINVARGISPTLNLEAMRVVSSMPRWTPGEQAGKKVAVRFTLPVTFKL